MARVAWGVRVGESVFLMESGLAAFREEARRRGIGERAAVVVCAEGVWVTLSGSSVLRADPVPPGPTALRWWGRLRPVRFYRSPDAR